MPREQAAFRRAESMSRDPGKSGTLAFKRSGETGDAAILKAFAEVP
jgi:hypothetical protein